jgi:signal transduction histidine kinase
MSRSLPAGYSAQMRLNWLRSLAASPWLDAAAGGVVTVATVTEERSQYGHPAAVVQAAAIILAALIGIPLAWRRRAPLAVLAVVLAAVVGSGALFRASAGAQAGGQGPIAPFLAVLLAVFSFGAYAKGRQVLAGGGVLAAGVLATALIAAGGQQADWGFWAAAGVFWVMGLLFRQRLLRVAELQAQTEHLRLEQEQKAQWAVIEERTRIARELHDVIAHSVSVMVIQAGAARHTLDPAVTDVRESLQSIETTGRQALVELRRLLGILRRPGDDPTLTLAPVPGLGRVSALVEQIRAAGLPTELHVEGQPVELAVGIDLAAYRIIQEALTNSLRHAGPAQAQVNIRFRPHELDLEISDNGRAPSHSGGSGHGLAGMRERVALYGGTLDAAYRDQGFSVHARLPMDRAPA